MSEKNRKLSIRLSENEMKRLVLNVQNSGLSVSEYCRIAILNSELTPEIKMVERKNLTKNIEPQKNQKLSIRFSEKEVTKILQEVQKSGLSISEYCRIIILNFEVEIIKMENAEIIIEHLKRVGNIINQIAHGMNKDFFMNTMTTERVENHLKKFDDVKLKQGLLLEFLLAQKKEKSYAN